LTPIDDPLVDLVIGVPALQREQGKRRSFLRCPQLSADSALGHVTINVLSDDDLREVFYHCHVNNANLFTWMWQPLVHVCQRWRRIIFASPHYLHLQLLCNNKTPARDSLDIWPPLPIVLSYQSDSVNGDQNIIVALEHQDRITKINFPKISRSVLERLSPFMQEPLPALTELDLSGTSVPVLPEAFLGGSAPCLQSCTLRDIAFPGLPKLLASTSQLVRLLLHDLPASGYIPPDAMGSCLATLPNLNRLIIEFRPPTSCPRLTGPPPARDILPSLTHFHFTGRGEYLEDLVAKIDAPCLHHFTVTFTVDFDFIASQLVRFISRSERIKDLHRADRPVELDPWSVRMSDELGGHLELGIRYSASSWELDSLEQLCNNLSPLLSQVEQLRICEDASCRVQPAADMECTQWLNIFLPFTAVYYLDVSMEMASVVIDALGELTRDDHRSGEVLPELGQMCFDSLDSSVCDEKVLDNFISDRREYADRKIDVMERLG